MYCIKSHINFQVSPSTSETFDKNLKIGRFYPGLPYSILLEKCIPDKRICFWKNLYNDPEDLDWEEIHFWNF